MMPQIKYSANVRMRYSPRQLYFAAQAVQQAGAKRCFLLDDFYRDALSKVLIFSFIHFTHAATAQELYDAISASQHLSRREQVAGAGTAFHKTAHLVVLSQQALHFRLQFQVSVTKFLDRGVAFLRRPFNDRGKDVFDLGPPFWSHQEFSLLMLL